MMHRVVWLSEPDARPLQISRIVGIASMPPPPDPHAQRQSTLSRAVRATSLMTLGSRVGGLVRDVVVGRIFGATMIGSAFSAAFAIPNMFRRLFGEGALSAAFIPAYTEVAQTSKEDADKLASLTITALGLVTTALTIVIELALLGVLLFAHCTLKLELSLKLIMVMLPFMPLICCVAIQAAILQVKGRYGPAASGPIILNTFIVGTGVYFLFTHQLGGEFTGYILGIATVLSGLTQALWFLHLLRPYVIWTRSWQSITPRAIVMFKKFIPVAIGLGTLQLNTFLDTLLAMWPIWIGTTLFGRVYPLDESSNVILSLTARLYQFPLGVFGVSIASAIFPLLSRHAKEPDHFLDTLRRGLRLSLYIGLPATLGLLLVRHEALSVLYGHGTTGWKEDAIRRAANVLAGFSVAIWAYSLNQVLTRAFYAQGDTKTPMKVAIAMILVNIVLNCTLIWIPGVQESGLAWATAISAILQTIVLSILCIRMVRATGTHHPIIDAHARTGILRIIVATAVMTAAVWLVLRIAPQTTPLASEWSWQLARLLAASGLGGIIYIVLSKIMHIAELQWLLHKPPNQSRRA